MPVIGEAYVDPSLPGGTDPRDRRTGRARRQPPRGVRLCGAEQRRLRAHHAGAGARRLGCPLLRVGAGAPWSCIPSMPSGREEHRRTWLPALASAEKKSAASASHEPDYGSNPAGMITRARETADGWVLNGTKMWITNGSMADVAIIWAPDARAGGHQGHPRLRRPRPITPGFGARDQKGKLSLLASDTSELVLDDVHVPHDALMPGSTGLKSPLMCLNPGPLRDRVGRGVGAAMACFHEAASYAGERVMFEGVIGGQADPAGAPRRHADLDHAGAADLPPPGAPQGTRAR